MASNAGERIAISRISKDISQRKLALILGISNSKLSRIESKNLPINHNLLTSICSALNESADYILFGVICDQDPAEFCRKYACLPPHEQVFLKDDLDRRYEFYQKKASDYHQLL